MHYTRQIIVSMSQSLNRPVVQVVAMLRKNFASIVINSGKDYSLRGNGNAALRRQGYVVEFGYNCSCDSSPCQHEFIREQQSENREEHQARRGCPTKLSRKFPIVGEKFLYSKDGFVRLRR